MNSFGGIVNGLYCLRECGNGSPACAAPLLGLRFLSSAARKNRPKFAATPGYLRGNAHRRRQISMLPAPSRASFRANRDRGVAINRADAGPRGATRADGNHKRIVE